MSGDPSLFEQAVTEVNNENAEALKDKMKRVYAAIISNTKKVEGYIAIRKEQVDGLSKSLAALKEVKTQEGLDEWNEDHYLEQYEPYNNGIQRKKHKLKRKWSTDDNDEGEDF